MELKDLWLNQPTSNGETKFLLTLWLSSIFFQVSKCPSQQYHQDIQDMQASKSLFHQFLKGCWSFMPPKWQISEPEGSSEGCKLLRLGCQRYLPVTFTRINSGELLCFSQVLNEIINLWGWIVIFKIEFRYLKLVQNSIDSSFWERKQLDNTTQSSTHT